MDKINDNVTKKLTFGIECGSFESEKIIVHKILLQRLWHIDQIQTIPKYIMKENETFETFENETFESDERIKRILKYY